MYQKCLYHITSVFSNKISDIFYIRTIQIITSIWVTWTAITEKSPSWPVIWVRHCRRHISLGCRPYWGSNRPPNPLSPLQHPPQWNDGPSWGCSRFLYWGPGIPQVPHQCVENLCPSVDYACEGCLVFPGKWRTRYPPCLFFSPAAVPCGFLSGRTWFGLLFLLLDSFMVPMVMVLFSLSKLTWLRRL